MASKFQMLRAMFSGASGSASGSPGEGPGSPAKPGSRSAEWRRLVGIGLGYVTHVVSPAAALEGQAPEQDPHVGDPAPKEDTSGNSAESAGVTSSKQLQFPAALGSPLWADAVWLECDESAGASLSPASTASPQQSSVSEGGEVHAGDEEAVAEMATWPADVRHVPSSTAVGEDADSVASPGEPTVPLAELGRAAVPPPGSPGGVAVLAGASGESAPMDQDRMDIVAAPGELMVPLAELGRAAVPLPGSVRSIAVPVDAGEPPPTGQATSQAAHDAEGGRLECGPPGQLPPAAVATESVEDRTDAMTAPAEPMVPLTKLGRAAVPPPISTGGVVGPADAGKQHYHTDQAATQIPLAAEGGRLECNCVVGLLPPAAVETELVEDQLAGSGAGDPPPGAVQLRPPALQESLQGFIDCAGSSESVAAGPEAFSAAPCDPVEDDGVASDLGSGILPDEDDEKVVDSEAQAQSAVTWLTELGTLVSEGMRVVEQVRGKDVVLLLGHTGAGKTSLLHFLAGSRLVRQARSSGQLSTVFVPDPHAPRPPGLQDFAVGHELQSQTRALMPFQRPGGTVVYLDCAGSMDTRGDEVDIATAVCLKRVAAAASSVRFVVVLSCADVETIRAGLLREIAQRLAHLVVDRDGGPAFKLSGRAFTFIFSHVRHLTGSVEWSGEAALRAVLVEILGKVIAGTDISEKDTTRYVLRFMQDRLQRGKAHLFHPEWQNRDLLLRELESTDPKDRLVSDPDRPLEQRISCRVSRANKSEILQRLKSFRRSVDKAFETEDFPDVQNFLLTMERLKDHIPLDDMQDFHAELRDLVIQKQAQLEELAHRLIQQGTGEEHAFSSLQADRVVKCLSALETLQARKSRGVLMQALSEGMAALAERVATQLSFKAPADPLPSVVEVRRCVRLLGVWAQAHSAEADWASHYAAAAGSLQGYLEQLLLATQDVRLPFLSLVAVSVRFRTILPHTAELLRYSDAPDAAPHVGAETLLQRRILEDVRSKTEVALELLASAADEGGGQAWEVRQERVGGFQARVQDLRAALSLLEAPGCEVPALAGPLRDAIGTLQDALTARLEEHDKRASGTIANGEFGAKLHGLLLTIHALANAQDGIQDSNAAHLQYQERVEDVAQHLRDCNSRLREQLEQLPSGEVDTAKLLDRCRLLQDAAWFDGLCPDKAFIVESLDEVRAALQKQQERNCREVEDELRSLLPPAAHAPAKVTLQKLRPSWERVCQLSGVREFCCATSERGEALRVQLSEIANDWCAAKGTLIGGEVRSLEDVQEAAATAVHDVLSIFAGLDFLPIQTEEVMALRKSAMLHAEQWKALGHDVAREAGFGKRTAVLKTLSRWAALELNMLTDGLPTPADLRDAIERAWEERVERVEATLRASPDAARAELKRLQEECLPPDADEVWRRLGNKTKLVEEKVALRLENVMKELGESLELLDFAAVKRHPVPQSDADAQELDRCQARVSHVKRGVRLRLRQAKESSAGVDLRKDLEGFMKVHKQVGDLLKEGPDPLDLAEEVVQLESAANGRLVAKLHAIQAHLDTSAYAEALDLLKDADDYHRSFEGIVSGRLVEDFMEKKRALDRGLGRLAEHVTSFKAALTAAAQGNLVSDVVDALAAELQRVRAAFRFPEIADLYGKQVGELRQALENFHTTEMQRVDGEHTFEAAIQTYTWLKDVMGAGVKDHLVGLSFDPRLVIEELREKEKAHSRQVQEDLVDETVIVGRLIPMFQRLYDRGNGFGMYRWYYSQDLVRQVNMLNAAFQKRIHSSSEQLSRSTYESSGNNLFSFLVQWKHLHKYAQAEVTVPAPVTRTLEDFNKLLQQTEKVLYLLTNLLIESLRVGPGHCALGFATKLKGAFSRYGSFVLHIIKIVAYWTSADLKLFPAHAREPMQALVQAYPGQLARFHAELAALTKSSLQGLVADLDAFDYKKAIASVQIARHLAEFLASPFAAYRDDLQDLRYRGDPHLAALDTLIAEWGMDRLAEMGKHYVALQLLPGAPPGEIRKAILRLSKEVHPDKQAGRGCHKLDPDAAQRRVNAAKEAFTKTHTNRDWHAELGCLFDSTVNSSVTQLQSRICEHLEEGAYAKVKNLLEAMRALEEFSLVCKLQTPVAYLVQQVHQTVRAHVEEASATVEKLWYDDALPQLQRQLDKLDSISSNLGGYPDIYSDDWRDKIKRGVQAKINDFAAEAGARLLKGKDSMHQFGMELLHLARIFDNLKGFKSQAVAQVNSLLDQCRAKQGGCAYLFWLGMLLEQGKLGRPGDDGRVCSEDQRLGRVIVKEFYQFRDVVAVTWNRQTEVTHKDVDSTLKGMFCHVCPAGGLPTGEGVVDRAQLKAGWEQYEAKSDELLGQWKKGDLKVEQIPAQAFNMVAKLPPCRSSSWPKDVTKALPELIAVIFAYFTISTSGENFQRLAADKGGEECVLETALMRPTAGYQRLANMGDGSMLTNEKCEELAPEMVLVRPHSVQILTLLHLLAYDVGDESLRTRLMQVRTGEGKSIILGGLSVICAILGFKVRCVCYSSYLSQRDYKMFEGMFKAFGVRDRVVYSTITQFSEHRTSTKGDIRERTVNLLQGRGAPPAPAPAQPPAAAAPADRAIAVGPRRLREDAEELLLIDEVDVFFGEDFYGQTYNVVATFPLEEAVETLEFLWRHRAGRSRPAAMLQKVKVECPAYSRLLEKLPDWRDLVESEVREMCIALRDYDKEPCNSYHYNEELKRIGYKVMDSYDYDVEYGYRTCFAWLEVADDPGRGLRDEKTALRKALQLRVPCGHFSYANIGCPTILGVSGTISALGRSEWCIMAKYGITGYSMMASVYGDSNLRIFDQTGNPPLTISAAADYLRDIADQAKETVRNGRAVIVFFKDPAQLHATKAFLNDPHVNLLLEVMEDRDKEYVIKKAATSGQITLATAVFGRGTDFFSSDPSLDTAGGVHVIQAFFSADQCQEVQIWGRTARQGKKGTFAWVLSETELTAVGLSGAHLKKREPALQYEDLKRVREERSRSHFDELEKRLAEATEKDELTHRYFDALLGGSTAEACQLFKAMYDKRVVPKGCATLSTCRMVCLSDATGSMAPTWKATKAHITEMLRRIHEFTGGNEELLEILWVAYRDYSDKDALLDNSGWCQDSAELQDFIDRIECNGGVGTKKNDRDGEEAVEHALEYARNQHVAKPVNRILLIGDAAPHPEKKGQKLEFHDHTLRTDYLEEAKALKDLGVPVFSFVVGTPCKENEKAFATFQEISDITGGKCDYLTSPDQLLNEVCVNALEEIGGRELVAEYRGTYEYP